MKRISMLVLLIVLFSCKKDDSNNAPIINSPTAFGLSYAVSDSDFSTTYNNLRTGLQDNKEVTILAEINHTLNAQSTGLEIRNTRLILFNDLSSATSLIKANQLAGLDLPQRIMVYEDVDANVFATYNSTAFLGARYDLSSSQLQNLRNSLQNFATLATNNVISENASTNVTLGQGIITLVSQNDFNTTYNKLRNAISDDANLTIISEVNHQTDAQTIGVSLDPTSLIVFGNPDLGSPIIGESQTAGLDLPQKMLVWEDSDGGVNISYNNPNFLADRFSVLNNTEVIDEMSSAMASLAVEASN